MWPRPKCLLLDTGTSGKTGLWARVGVMPPGRGDRECRWGCWWRAWGPGSKTNGELRVVRGPPAPQPHPRLSHPGLVVTAPVVGQPGHVQVEGVRLRLPSVDLVSGGEASLSTCPSGWTACGVSQALCLSETGTRDRPRWLWAPWQPSLLALGLGPHLCPLGMTLPCGDPAAWGPGLASCPGPAPGGVLSPSPGQ